MNPAIFQIILAAMDLLEAVMPKIKSMTSGNVISIEDQKMLHERFRKLATRADEQFSGPQWEIKPTASSAAAPEVSAPKKKTTAKKKKTK